MPPPPIRLILLQRMETFAVHGEVSYVRKMLESNVESIKESITAVNNNAVGREIEMQRKLEARHAATEEVRRGREGGRMGGRMGGRQGRGRRMEGGLV